ncbi:o-succinylbenzoate--CoA ligase [soil metagenome]
MNIANTLVNLAAMHPQRLALIEGANKVTSYLELNNQVVAVASHLRKAGIAKGDVVLLYVGMSSQLYALLLGINRIGAVVLFIDPTYGFKELHHCILLTKPKAIVVDDRLHFLARLAAPLLAIRTIFFQNEFVRATSKTVLEPVVEVEPNAPALITFTSGSSALPKGIVRTHGFLETQCQILAEDLSIGRCRSEITTLPIFVLANLACGVTSILPANNLRGRSKLKQRAQRAALLEQLLEHMPERILAAPAFLLQLAHYLKLQNIKCYFVKEILSGGGPIFPQLTALLREVFPEAKLLTVYGSTEAEPIAHLDVTNCALDSIAKIAIGSGLPQGKVSPHVDLAIISGPVLEQYIKSEFSLKRAGANEIGEILVSGKHVVEGYISAIGDRENKIKVGNRIFHRTGDAGYLDEDGNLYLVGRIAQKVEVGGRSVYPLAVEASAMASGLVDSCAFLEVDKKKILVVKLIAGAPKNSEALLLKQLVFAAIDKIVIRANLPMDKRHSSKVLYNKLKSSL